MQTFHPTDLLGRTFLMNPDDDGQIKRACIVEAIKAKDDNLSKDPSYKKFRIEIKDKDYEEILSYNKVLEHIERKENDSADVVWKFRHITAHEGPLRDTDRNYKG